MTISPSKWSSGGDGGDAFLTINLGSQQDEVGAELLTRFMANGTATADTFWVVVDDVDWLGPFPAGNPSDPNFAPVGFRGTIIRFEMDTSTGGNTGAIEVRVFGPATTVGSRMRGSA